MPATATKGKAPKPAPGKTMAKQQATVGGELVPVDEALLGVLAQHAGSGLGNAQASDFALPFIYLLQKMSPAVDEIEGAEEGMFLNTVTRRITDEVTIIPVEYDKVFNEWIPRNDGGGFVASHRTLAAAEQNKKEDWKNDKNKVVSTQIVETANHYVLELQEDGTWNPAILSLTSTKLKASRTLMSRITQVVTNVPGKGQVQMPSFAKKYVVRPTGPHTNDKGRYFSVEIAPVEGNDGWVSEASVVQQAISFQQSLKAGSKGADFSKLNEEVVQVEEEDEEEKASGKKKF